MEKIGLITDEAADLPEEIIEKHRIVLVPVKLFWPEIEKLPGENTFQKMRELEKKGIQSFGKTSQPSMKDFLDKYNLQLGIFEKVLCFTLTSKLSGTYNSAIQAKRFLRPDRQNKVFVIDSLSASGGQALLILRAIELIESSKKINLLLSPSFRKKRRQRRRQSLLRLPSLSLGRAKEAEEMVKELTGLISKIHFYIMFEDPKWIEASGRISHLVASLMRGMAKAGIRPVLSFKNGILAPTGLKTGAKDIPTGLFKQFESDIKKLKIKDKKIKVIITHCDDLPGVERLEGMIEKEFKNVEIVFVNILNNVVGAVAGPNTLTLAWREN